MSYSVEYTEAKKTMPSWETQSFRRYVKLTSRKARRKNDKHIIRKELQDMAEDALYNPWANIPENN